MPAPVATFEERASSAGAAPVIESTIAAEPKRKPRAPMPKPTFEKARSAGLALGLRSVSTMLIVA